MKRESSRRSGRTLGAVRREFERWRQDPSRAWRIPEVLWRAAVEAAREHGVSCAARELRLDYYSLQKRLGSSVQPSSGFVEVAWPALATAPECRLELENGHGIRLRVELRGAAVADLEALASGLWGSTR